MHKSSKILFRIYPAVTNADKTEWRVGRVLWGGGYCQFEDRKQTKSDVTPAILSRAFGSTIHRLESAIWPTASHLQSPAVESDLAPLNRLSSRTEPTCMDGAFSYRNGNIRQRTIHTTMVVML